MGQEINMNKPLFLRAADRERSKRRAQYRYKTTEHVQNRKHKRDIILLAVKDYKTILRCLMRNPYNQDAQREKKRLERFFFSQWFG